MNKKVISVLIAFHFAFLSIVSAEITSITKIESIKPSIKKDTLVLFNIAEVLMDTELCLGSSPWRRYVRKRLTPKQHDLLTLLITKEVPPKVAEAVFPELVRNLQKEGIVTLAFTSRGRHEWYSSQIKNIDIITENLLNMIGFDFSLTKLPKNFAAINEKFPEYFHNGVVYTTNTLDKGELLQKMLNETDYRPAHVILVDDKQDGLESVEAAMKTFGIPFSGFLYKRTAEDRKNFDLMASNIQFEMLLFHDLLIDDQDALEIKNGPLSEVDADEYFMQIIDLCDFDSLEQILTN